MENENFCCICLDELCEYNTNCCRNPIHKSCLINWFLYKGEFSCPMCRNEKIRVNLEDILHYKSNCELNIDESTLIKNINNLVNSYNIEYRITIDLPNQTSYPYNSYLLRYRCIYSSLSCSVCFPNRALRHCSYLLLIPVMYFIMFILFQYVNLHKTDQVNAIIDAD